ncbi:MAG: hypothetical protein C5B59_14395 [Bacteroidetes bacterium]|nr:MAG: hypothetical protein C5B59_14395 [Bacteroidota bacterium]
MRSVQKILTLEMVEGSSEIQTWLNQFSDKDRVVATDLLLKLKFVPRDAYSEWLKTTLSGLSENQCGLYAVRKFGKNEDLCLWNASGEMLKRQNLSLGSEDLVRSVIAGLMKSDKSRFLDHPSLNELRDLKVHEIALIDDSIGSGKRVSDYIKIMLTNKTFLSWWSFGWIRFHIVAFARTNEATKIITDEIPGSNHPIRKHRKSEKLNFSSDSIYQTSQLEARWGREFQGIVNLCASQKAIPARRRLGFRGTMSNLVFYHSVPNNIPGMLWHESESWTPLFPSRSVPEWLPTLLDGASLTPRGKGVSDSMLALLQLIKRGIRNQNSLARSLGVDGVFLQQLILSGKKSGFLTSGNRLTKAGVQIIWATQHGSEIEEFDRSLYVPEKWCVDRRTI